MRCQRINNYSMQEDTLANNQSANGAADDRTSAADDWSSAEHSPLERQATGLGVPEPPPSLFESSEPSEAPPPPAHSDSGNPMGPMDLARRPMSPSLRE